MIIGFQQMTPEDQAIHRALDVPFNTLWHDGTDYQRILSMEVSKAGLIDVPCCDMCGSESIVMDGPCRWSASEGKWENVDVYDSDPYCDECDAETGTVWRYRKVDAKPFQGDDERREQLWRP